MSVEEKAVRLVRTGAVSLLSEGVTDSGEPITVYQVEGDHARYTVRWDGFGVNCDCPSSRRCSHQVAVVLYSAATRAGVVSGNVIDNDAAT